MNDQTFATTLAAVSYVFYWRMGLHRAGAFKKRGYLAMNGRSFTVLVASPDRSLLRRSTRFLEICGYSVIAASRFDQARRYLAAHVPDFLILDPALQSQEALHLARQARERNSGRTFTLLLTNQPSVPELLAGLQAGCDDFLSHPISFGEWLARLKGGARALEFERRLNEKREIDSVSGLRTRSALERLIRSFVEARQRESTASLILLQFDSGLPALDAGGTNVDKSILVRAREQFRLATPRGAVSALWTDTTLALFWPGETESQAATWAEQVRLKISAPEQAAEASQITWSAGVAEWKAGQTADAWLEACAQSLDLAAKSGGDCVATSRQCTEASETWSVEAAAGKLFATTSARDVMSLCPLILSRDETIDAAAALLRQTAMPLAPVVDDAGTFVGAVTPEHLDVRLSRPPVGRQSGSVRLLRHCLASDIPQFDEFTSLADLLDFFGADPQPFAIILSQRRPVGVIYCEALACLSERLTPDALRPPDGTLSGSDYLVISENSAT